MSFLDTPNTLFQDSVFKST